MNAIPVVLSIAGSDSGGGAGIQADIKAISACGGFAATAITAITAQNTVEVRAAVDLPLDLVSQQVEAVMDDLCVAAVKTGMLGSSAMVTRVAQLMRERQPAHLVVDPVMIAKSGFRLLRDEAVDSLRQKLLPLATVVTPNRLEAELLAGTTISGPEDMEPAARAIHAMGARAVVVKGGHLEGAETIDLLFDGHAVHRFSAPRVATSNTHGTGCTFASALATFLALGTPLPEAVRRTKEYVTEAVKHGLPLGQGHGPTDHFFFLRK